MANQILKGVRVIEWTVVWAGPLVANILAEMGAEVIHVDHPKFLGVMGTYPPQSVVHMAQALGLDNQDIKPDIAAQFQEAPYQGIHNMEFSALTANRKFIALDTTKSEGYSLLREIIKVCDVSLNNLTENVSRKLGITYADLKSMNPNIINCSMPAFGRGPWSEYVAYGSTLECATGIVSLNGYGGEDRDQPIQSTGGGFVVNPIAAMQATGAIIAALIHRAKTGRGTNIEVSQFEAGTHLLNTEMNNYVINKKISLPDGNNDHNVLFQGCYPAKGEDQWMVISIRNQAEWINFCHLIGKTDWLNSNVLGCIQQANKHRRKVDLAITQWTKNQTKSESTRKLQNMKIAAAPVNNNVEVLFDPQVKHRGLYHWVVYPYGATAPSLTMPVRFSKTTFPDPYRPAQAIGADNQYIYGDILGLKATEIKKLEDAKIIKR